MASKPTKSKGGSAPRTKGTAKREGAKGGRPPHAGLSPQQAAAIPVLLAAPTHAAAARKLGTNPRTISRWLGEPAFAAEFDRELTEYTGELRRRLIASRDQVWDVFVELLHDENPRVRQAMVLWHLQHMLAEAVRLTDTPWDSELQKARTALLARVELGAEAS